jgi:hypothetical protein
MNQQAQNSPSKPFEPVTVGCLAGDNLTVSVHTVSSEHDEPLVFVSGDPDNPYGPLSGAFESQAACDLALAILQAARPHLAWEVTLALGELMTEEAWQRSQAFMPEEDSEAHAAIDAEAKRMQAANADDPR